MSTRTISLDEALYGYLLSTGVRESAAARELRQATAALPMARMQISPEQGAFMQLLVRLSGARRTLEIGTFTGYSALVVAEALPVDGQIITCDISAEWTSIACRYWQRAGVAGRIDLRLRPALETLDELLAGKDAGSFDFAFIDADKENYGAYYERALALLKPGGLIAVDNALWGGAVADPARTDAETLAIRELNRRIHGDPRVDMSLLPVGDGLMLARKREPA